MKTILALALFIAVSIASFAQINPSDPTLRLWLKADTLSGTTVPLWTDSASYGTKLAVPPVGTADPNGNDVTNHTPQLLVVTNNNREFNAVLFRQANDPVAALNHLADRLWQTNNLDANDPTLIAPTEDITLITVYRNNVPGGGIGVNPCIVAKRGSSACPYEFSFYSPERNHALITYAGSVVYSVGDPIPSVPEWGIIEMNVTAAGVLTFRQYYSSIGGWKTFTRTGVSRGGFSVGEPFTISCHTQAGTADNPLGNGAYERFSGLLAEVALYNRTLSSNELEAAENYLLLKYFLQAGPPVITTQPQSQQVAVFSPVSFNVVADGTPPFSYQWLKGGVPISGAPDSPTYSIASTAPGDSGTYSVKVSNGINFTNSQNAILTVTVPTNKPTVTSALLSYGGNTSLTVTFSQLVSVSTATNASNYSINNGVTVSGVTTATNTNFVTSVVLTTSPITASPSILTVNGVQDTFGNVIATNSQVVVPIPGAVGTPPSGNLVLWLAADTNVLSDSIGVYEWDDRSGAANDHSAFPAFGNVKVGQISFPNANHPVLSFDGTCALQVANTADFNLQTLTIYLVGDLDGAHNSDDFIGNWEGFVLGGSDGPAGALKWSTWGDTGGGVGGYFPIDPSPVLGNRVPALIVGAFANPGNQTLDINTVRVGTRSNTVPILYTTARGMIIGALFPTPTQNLYGDIAEILIYSSVSPAQDTAVQNYLISKYFTPSATGPRLLSASVGVVQQNTNVTVVFSDAVTASTAANASKYSINNGVTVSGATVVNGTTVILTTSAINAGLTNTLTASGVTDWAGNAADTQIVITVPSDTTRAQYSLGSTNLLVLEAEHYNLNTPAGGKSWIFTTAPPLLMPTDANTNYSGAGAMLADPNTEVNLGTPVLGSVPAGSTRLDFKVQFNATGTNYVWVRGVGDSAPGLGANDSVFIGLDGALTTRLTGFPGGQGYAWGNSPVGDSGPIVISTPGFHVINVWMREDGFTVDKLLLASDSAFTPTNLGPAESSAIGLGPTITLTRSGANLILSWPGGGALQSSTNVIGTYVDIPASSSPFNVTPSGTQKYYRIRQ